MRRRRRRLAGPEQQAAELENRADNDILVASQIGKAALRGFISLSDDAEELLDLMEEAPGMVNEVAESFMEIKQRADTFNAQLVVAWERAMQYRETMEEFWELQDSMVEVPRSDSLRRR